MKLESKRSLSWAVAVAVPALCTGLVHAQHSVDFQMTNEWDVGYNADIILKADPGGSTVNSWTLSWMGTPEIAYFWNCTHSEQGDRNFFENVHYNETIQPGSSVTLGFTGIGSWPPAPMDVRLNGETVMVMIEGDVVDHGDHGSHCMGDIDADGFVDGEDIALILSAWNTSDERADLDGSTIVDGADLTMALSMWGECPHDDHADDGDGHGGGDDDGHDGGDGHDDPCMGEFTKITCWGDFHGSNHNSHEDELVGGRTAITTEAMIAYNNLRAFFELPALALEDVGQWAFDEALTNNSQAWGNDLKGVGLWYAMQGAKVGWITDEAYDPQILADIQRTARLVEDEVEMTALVMDMVREFGRAGYADYLEANGMVETFINTLRMEPHYGGWMHGRTHGFRSIEGVAINHDINHLTVLSWDQMDPFMNDTFDWPQWPALDVSDSGVIEYYQSMVVLGDPVGDNL